MVFRKNIQEFLKNTEIAVIGASSNSKKFGNIVLKKLHNTGYCVFPVNPKETEILGISCYKSIADLPDTVKTAVFITQPEITEQIMKDICSMKIIKAIWFQPGSENKNAIEISIKNVKNVIYDECIMMHLKPLSFPHNTHKFINVIFGKYPK
ncbi:MAG TPA: CoA-binding protein [Bacteroidales bacterium]|nr:CoA-binding protein [Bacteroidales bacterium]HQH18104.1 CoA-binding protein [Bacteroidales bacterium]HQI45541.1 CoA-binding protein [Bacteroidales bacterium]